MNNVTEYNPVLDTTSIPGDAFGVSTAISGINAIIGSHVDDAPLINSGSVSFFQFDGTNWIMKQKLVDATAGVNDWFGWSVSISGNYAIVGAPYDDVGPNPDQGSVSIYQYNGTNWVLMQKITDATGAGLDLFGWCVSINGNMAIVGAPGDDISTNADQGSVSIYQFNGTNWILMQKLTDSPGGGSDQFGYSVSISGMNVAIGSPYYDAAGVDRGCVVTYRLVGGSLWQFVTRLTDDEGIDNDLFGFGVAVSPGYLFIGAPDADVGANIHQGNASIYQFKILTSPTWVFLQKLTETNNSSTGYFGRAICHSGNYLIIGSNHDDPNGNSEQGSATIFERVGHAWKKLQYIKDPAGAVNDVFGTGVGIDESTKRFVIGAPGFASAIGNAIFGKVNN
jgi:hypothetical protein